ncbi:unannotated protein [freshwater metagenome]|uniref:Unannotated protein n=1 Tax=freshwater metagenome TaxID=449393 RepID=A0A6J7FAE9_9ZZZZ
MSVQIGIPERIDCSTMAVLGETPGETISKSGAKASSAACKTSALGSITHSTPKTSKMSRTSSSAASDTTSNVLPNSLRVSATEKPDLPKPKTPTFTLGQLELQLFKCWRSGAWLAINPLEVEKADSSQNRKSCNNPEPNNHRDFCPALKFKVMVQW